MKTKRNGGGTENVDENKIITVYNQPGYSVQISKRDTSGKGIEKASFQVQEYTDKTNINTIKNIKKCTTNEKGNASSDLKIAKTESNTRIFRITETEVNSNYYLNNDTRPVVRIKYEKSSGDKNGKWYVLKEDIKMDENEWKGITDNDIPIPITKVTDEGVHYTYIYSNGVKIGVGFKGTKIIIKVINDEVATIGIRKIDSDTQERINGVGFKIYFKDENDKEIFNYISSYKYNPNDGFATVSWTTKADEAEVFITGHDDYGDGKYPSGTYNAKLDTTGLIILKGLPKKVYYAKEQEKLEYQYSEEKEYKIHYQNRTKVAYGDKNDKSRYEYKGWFGQKMTIKNQEQYVIQNEPSRTIGIQKVDNDNQNIKLNGVKFKIYRKSGGEIEYLKKYMYGKNGAKEIVWTDPEKENEKTAEANAIEFITGYDYLDGKTYEKGTEPKTKGNDGEITLKGMESKTYFAKETSTNEYYKLSKSTYRTKERCSGTDTNWLVYTGNEDENSKIYTIKFEQDGGTEGTDQIYYKNGKLYSDEKATKEIKSITIPKKEGMAFAGYKVNSYESEYDFNSVGALVNDSYLGMIMDGNLCTSDLTLYATWERIDDSSTSENIYKLTFKRNGGTGGTTKIYLKGQILYKDEKCETAITGNIKIPENPGNTFLGYKMNGQQQKFDFDESGKLNSEGELKWLIDNDCIEGDITLYAMWEKTEVYTISFNKNGGESGTNEIYLKDGELYSDKECKTNINKIDPPTKDGYIFQGYKIDSSSIEYDFDKKGKLNKLGYLKSLIDNYGIKDIVLYACWEKCTITNQQMYIDISGKVWLDGIEGKDSTKNNLYDDDENLLKGVKVSLKQKSNGDEVEGYSVITTGKTGEYKFSKVLVSKLKNYYVEFEYNGLVYESVELNTRNDNGSKAEESKKIEDKISDGEITRSEFNEQFATIQKGESLDSKGQHTNNLSYNRDTSNYKSELITTMNDFSMKSKTQVDKTVNDSSYLSTEYTRLKNNSDKIVTEIENVNLGLLKRNQPDMALAKDLEDVTLTINGQAFTYKYAERGGYDGFDVAVKFGDKYAKMTYTRPIYKSDYLWNPDDTSKELTAYATYKIQIKNQSTALKTQINSIVDYYSDKYELQGIGTKDASGNINYGQIKYEEIDNNYANYSKIKVDTTSIGKIDGGYEKDIYMQFKVSKDVITKILGKEDVEGTGESLKNVVEINSYSIFDQNDNIYAGVDTDSEPGNAELENISTYEDDTDTAPGLGIIVKENRSISGMVFLDSTTNELKTGEIRQGDGKYSNEESGIGEVTVRLIDTTDEKTKIVAEAKTNDNGEFSISGFIPGENYKIEYEWGNNKVGNEEITVQNYKATIYDENRYNTLKDNKNKTWYTKDADERYSDAMDNYTTREEIDSKMKNITYDTYTQYENDKTKSKMESSTLSFLVPIDTDETAKFKIEDNKIKCEPYLIGNIDFGIVERARQEIQLTKRVSAFKITLANGVSIVDATVKEKENGTRKMEGSINYVSYMQPSSNTDKGFIKAEIDSEIMQGATVEITYEFGFKNNSEVDINNENYYNFGINIEQYIYKQQHSDYTVEFGGRKYWINQDDIVKITPNKIIDYLENDWKYIDTPEWKTIENKTDFPIYNNDTKRKTITDKQVIYSDALTNESILPKESNKKELTLKVSKLISPTEKEINVNNDAEVIELTKKAETSDSSDTKIMGSQIKSKPGNYEYSKSSETHETDDDQAEQVMIIPNSGANLNYATPIIIAILSLSVLTTGIIIIKKKVLGNIK